MIWLLLTMHAAALQPTCSAEVAAAVRDRQAVHNRQELRNTISSRQRSTSTEQQGALTSSSLLNRTTLVDSAAPADMQIALVP